MELKEAWKWAEKAMDKYREQLLANGDSQEAFKGITAFSVINRHMQSLDEPKCTTEPSQVYVPMIAFNELSRRVYEIERYLVRSDKLIKCCYSCKNANNGNNNSCKLSEAETAYCIDNNFKHWEQ